MSRFGQSRLTYLVAVFAVIRMLGMAGYAQPNPYRVVPNWHKLPKGGHGGDEFSGYGGRRWHVGR